MGESLTLPLGADELPESLRRFCSPQTPVPARTMAAKGIVPIKGAELVFVLLQLANDPEAGIAASARDSLDKLPDEVLLAAAEAPGHPAFLVALSELHSRREDVLERIVANPATHDVTLAQLARVCSERLSERIALNQQRLLAAPRIIEALYKNKHTRMSTADRLVELAARNDVRLDAIPAFDAHVAAIRGQLIPEPSDEPLPGDELFSNALAEDETCSATGEDVVEVNAEAEEENIKASTKPLMMRIADMTMPEKIRLALVGNAAARALLVRDKNRTVASAAINSPSMTDAEAASIARSREVSEEILRVIGNRREWLRNHEVKRALIFNPKTPVGISLRFVAHLRDPELKQLAKSRGVPQAVKTSAMQKLEAKNTKR